MINTTFNCAEAYAKEFNAVKAKVTRRLARLEEDFPENLANGFQSCIEIDDLHITEANNSTDFHDSQHPWQNPTVFTLRATSGTSGSFAEAKMATLKDWTSKAATGHLTMQELKEYLEAHPNYSKHYPLVKEIMGFEDVSQLLRRHHECLRDEFDFTVFAGGIRVPVTGFNGFRGEIRITFSALTAEEDVSMCILILRTLQEALKEATTDDWFEYNLSALQAIPMINFHLKMWDIHKVA